jgi:hypothetical protein
MQILTLQVLCLIKGADGIHRLSHPGYQLHQVVYGLNGEPLDGCIVVEGEEIVDEVVPLLSDNLE